MQLIGSSIASGKIFSGFHPKRFVLESNELDIHRDCLGEQFVFAVQHTNGGYKSTVLSTDRQVKGDFEIFGIIDIFQL